jgi:phosphoribosylanthranilate isomerase
MLVKICGINDQQFLTGSRKLDFDLAGFIFYPGSPRYAAKRITPEMMDNLPNGVKKVGVFVNEDPLKVIETARSYALDYLQLHGDESPEILNEMYEKFNLIKAFRLHNDFNFKTVEPFQKYCDYFLFDTYGKNYGGTGIKFDWGLLSQYRGETPFILSGGIGPEDAARIKRLNHPQFAGIDINSEFETEPGVKDLQQINNFLIELR